MRILVTGGAGYIGSKLVKKLLDEGFGVKVFDSLVFGGESPLIFSDNTNFQIVKGSVTDRTEVKKALLGCDAVIHMAALVFIGDGKLAKFINEVNYEGTKIVAEAIPTKSIKPRQRAMIFCSRSVRPLR